MHVSCRHLRQMCNHGEVRKHPWSWINWEKISPARARGGVGGWWWWWWWRAATIQQIEGLMEHLLSPGLIHGYGMLLVFFLWLLPSLLSPAASGAAASNHAEVSGRTPGGFNQLCTFPRDGLRVCVFKRRIKKQTWKRQTGCNSWLC